MKSLDEVARRFEGVTRRGKGYRVLCPVHGDTTPSLDIDPGDNGGIVFVCRSHACPVESILKAVGLTWGDISPDSPASPARNPATVASRARTATRSASDTPTNAKASKAKIKAPRGPIVAEYLYRDAAGNLLYRVTRHEPGANGKKKDFLQWRPDGRGGWLPGLDKDTPRVLYRLPELLAAVEADPDVMIFLVEGEKDCHALADLGLIATTSATGASNWRSVDLEPLRGCRVAILPDADVAGEGYAQGMASRLYGMAASVKIIRLPDMPPHDDGTPRKDVSDWLSWPDGGADEHPEGVLLQWASESPEWTPATSTTGGAESPTGGAVDSEPVITRLADVTPRPVEWLWKSRIALGKLTLLSGDPGLGKSFITLDLAARVSRGTPWPDCPHDSRTPGGVVLLSAEDDLADTVRPRLDAAGADVSRVIATNTVRRFDTKRGKCVFAPFNLADNLPDLERAIRQTANCRLVVIDPISAYLGGTDDHKNGGIRALLSPLSELAARHGVAVVAVSHLRKGEGPAMYRSMGSLAFVAAARAAYAVAKDKADATGERRVFLPIKNNIGNDRDGLAYRLDSQYSANGQPVVAWESTPITVNADEALSSDTGRGDGIVRKQPGPEPVAQNMAADWLKAELAGGVARPVAELKAAAGEAGVSWAAVRKVSSELGVKPERTVFGGSYTWRIPGTPPDTEADQ